MKRLIRRLDPGTWSVRTFVTLYLALGLLGIVGGAL